MRWILTRTRPRRWELRTREGYVLAVAMRDADGWFWRSEFAGTSGSAINCFDAKRQAREAVLAAVRRIYEADERQRKSA